jgi:hypothetical protein
LSTGSAKYGLTGPSSGWHVGKGQTGFFARGGFPASPVQAGFASFSFRKENEG